MSTEHLIACAEYLLNRPAVDRTQSDINRAASTHYYALFHELADACATFMIGPKPLGHGRRAWQQVYRALEHKTSKSNCKNKLLLEKFPQSIRDFANHFIQMQERRHQSDYDPLAEVTSTEIEFDIASTRTILETFRNEAEIDRRAFCAFVIFQNREDPLRAEIERQREKAAKEERKKEQIAKQKAAKGSEMLASSSSTSPEATV